MSFISFKGARYILVNWFILELLNFVLPFSDSQSPFKRQVQQGYSTIQHYQQQEESVYQTIPFDLPMYEVQTVTVELGPDHAVAVERISTLSETTSYSLGMSGGVNNDQYISQEEHHYETVFSSQLSMYEEQTLTLEMGSEDTVEVESIFSRENKVIFLPRLLLMTL